MPMMRPDASWLIVTLTSIPIGFSAGRRNGEKSSPGALIHDHSCTRLQGLQVGWLVSEGGLAPYVHAVVAKLTLHDS
jgi:hypothetical protein